MNYYYLLFFIFFFTLCFVTSITVLLQESKSLGLGSSFGGDASTSLFGTSTADVIKKITSYAAVIFVASSFVFSSITTSDTTVVKPFVAEYEKEALKKI